MLVVEEGFDLVQDNNRKVGIELVDSMHPDHDVAYFCERKSVGQLLGLKEVVFGDM
jgi:hypothetical protein